MEDYITQRVLSNEELENLPLFFKTIFYNDLTEAEDEEKLFKYNSKIQTNYMRHYDPNRIICKTFDTKVLFQNEKDVS